MTSVKEILDAVRSGSSSSSLSSSSNTNTYNSSEAITTTSVAAAVQVYPLPHQLKVIEALNQALIDSKIGFVNASSVGLGKTITTLLFLLQQIWKVGIGFRALIVVPTSVLKQWQEEWVVKLGLPPQWLQIYHGANRKFQNSCFLTLTTIGVLLSEYKRPRKENSDGGGCGIAQVFAVVVLDETQKFSNVESEDSQRAAEQIPLYAKVLASLCRKFTILLSATPLTNSLSNIRSFLTLIGVENRADETQLQIMEKYQQCSIRMTRKDIPQMAFPNTVYETRLVELCASAQKLHADKMTVYSALMGEIQQNRSSGRTTPLFLLRKLNALTTELRLLEGAGCTSKESVDHLTLPEILQLPKVVEILQKMQKASGRWVIASSFVCILKMLERALIAAASELESGGGGEGVVERRRRPLFVFTGELSQRDRENRKQQFLSSTNGILLLSKKAGGVALSLHASGLINFEPDFSFASEEQVIGRIQRLGQTHTVAVLFLICKQGMDSLLRKLQITKLLLSSAFCPDDKEKLKILFNREEVEAAEDKARLLQQKKQKSTTNELTLLGESLEEQQWNDDGGGREEKGLGGATTPLKDYKPQSLRFAVVNSETSMVALGRNKKQTQQQQGLVYPPLQQLRQQRIKQQRCNSSNGSGSNNSSSGSNCSNGRNRSWGYNKVVKPNTLLQNKFGHRYTPY